MPNETPEEMARRHSAEVHAMTEAEAKLYQRELIVIVMERKTNELLAQFDAPKDAAPAYGQYL